MVHVETNRFRCVPRIPQNTLNIKHLVILAVFFCVMPGHPIYIGNVTQLQLFIFQKNNNYY